LALRAELKIEDCRLSIADKGLGKSAIINRQSSIFNSLHQRHSRTNGDAFSSGLAFAHFLHDITGQVFVFFILTVAAAESAIGLAILLFTLSSVFWRFALRYYTGASS